MVVCIVQVEKEEQAKREQEQQALEAVASKDWAGAVPEVDQWTEEWTTEGTSMAGTGGAAQQPLSGISASSAPAGPATGAGEEWNVGPSTKDWAADDTGDWGSGEPQVKSS